MTFNQPITQIIRRRYSCRKFNPASDSRTAFQALDEYLAGLPAGPFNAPNRFTLVASNGDDQSALRGLGSYGAMKDPAGYVIGASRKAGMDMEDFGYRMELIILKATELGLGSCWLGGFFTRSAFAKRIKAARDEFVPAVCPLGIPAVAKSLPQIGQSRSRFEWEVFFFSDNFETPLKPDQAGEYASPLEMTRLAPSAQNLQPWRIVRQGGNWHFYLQRNRGYHEMVVPAITKIPDLQRIDMGIAMAHFELAAREAGLDGHLEVRDPGILLTNKLVEYSVTWAPGGSR